jgi:hypothetical protein
VRVTRYKLYADRPGKAARQFLTDLFVVAWVYGWIWAAIKLHDLVQKLAVPGQKLEGAGNGIASNLSDAGRKVDSLPLAGNTLSAPFDKAASAARTLADAGRQQQHIVGDLSLALALALVIVPLALALFGWLPLRVRWMRRAGAARRVAATSPLWMHWPRWNYAG